MKRAFEVKQKAFFIIFKGLSVIKFRLRPESASLKFFKAVPKNNPRTHPPQQKKLC